MMVGTDGITAGWTAGSYVDRAPRRREGPGPPPGPWFHARV